MGDYQSVLCLDAVVAVRVADFTPQTPRPGAPEGYVGGGDWTKVCNLASPPEWSGWFILSRFGCPLSRLQGGVIQCWYWARGRAGWLTCAKCHVNR